MRQQKNVMLKLRSNHAEATTEVWTKIPWQKPRRVKVCPIWSHYYIPPENWQPDMETPLGKEKTPYQKYQFWGSFPTPHLWEPWMVSRTPRGFFGGSAARRLNAVGVSKNRRHENTRTKQAIPFSVRYRSVSMSHHGFNKYLHCWILWNCWPLI